jgi:hypothetical protein
MRKDCCDVDNIIIVSLQRSFSIRWDAGAQTTIVSTSIGRGAVFWRETETCDNEESNLHHKPNNKEQAANDATTKNWDGTAGVN